MPNFCGISPEKANLILGMVRDVNKQKKSAPSPAGKRTTSSQAVQQQQQQPPSSPLAHQHVHQQLAPQIDRLNLNGQVSRPPPPPSPQFGQQQQQQQHQQHQRQPSRDRPLPQTPGHAIHAPAFQQPAQQPQQQQQNYQQPPRQQPGPPQRPYDPYGSASSSSSQQARPLPPPQPTIAPPLQQQQQQQQQRVPPPSSGQQPQQQRPSPPSVNQQQQQPASAASAPVAAAAAAGVVSARPPSSVRRGKIGLEDFNFLTVLGKGNFGKVMLAEEKTSTKLYAIKVLKKEFIIENDEVDSTKSEKQVFLAAADKRGHPFLLNLHSCFQTETRIYFVMEYISGGDLMLHIQRKQFSVRQAKFYACEVLLALEYFHQKGIIYRSVLLCSPEL